LIQGLANQEQSFAEMNGPKIEQVGILGAGLMGSGIASVLAAAGTKVFLRDTDPARITNSQIYLKSILRELESKGLLSAPVDQSFEKITTTLRLADLTACQLVLEAVPENLDLKRQIYLELEELLPAGAILASNTSGFMPSMLSEKLRRPELFLVAHFWNPPHAIPLVEIVPSTRTDRTVVTRVVEYLRTVGAEPVVIEKELPGFIGNRLQYALLREALAIVRSGAADAEGVDTVMKASLGRRYATVGPLETADLGGLDTFLSIATHLMPQLAKDEGVLDLLRQRVEKGEIGLRSGQGFYAWPSEKADQVVRRRNEDLLRRRLIDRTVRD
jgi:3-hydroxybutyryl-CoA dehydrogenase